MNKKALIKELEKEVYCRLRPSRISGVGVFAIRTIPKGKNPFSRHDTAQSRAIPILTIMRNKRIPRSVKQYIIDMVLEENDMFMFPDCGINLLDIAYYVNHSKTPNMITKDGGAVFVAKRTIRAGEELTINYKAYGQDPTFRKTALVG